MEDGEKKTAGERILEGAAQALEMVQTKWMVRQYYPNFCSGFEVGICGPVEFSEITEKPAWMGNFRKPLRSPVTSGDANTYNDDHGFSHWSIAPYPSTGSPDEIIISAVYKDKKSWVAAFACPADSETSKGWRYKAGQEC